MVQGPFDLVAGGFFAPDPLVTTSIFMLIDGDGVVRAA